MSFRFTYRQRLFFAVAAVVATLGGLVWGGAMTLARQAKRAASMEHLADVSDRVMGLQMRALELADDMRRLREETAEAVKKRFARLREEAPAVLEEVAQDLPPELAEPILGLKPAIEAFCSAGTEWIDQRVKVGLSENAGLRARFRKAAHELEAGMESGSLVEAFLQVRRMEKDFFLRVDEKYLQKHRDALARFRQAIENLPYGMGNRFLPYVERYEKAFQEAAQGVLAMARAGQRADQAVAALIQKGRVAAAKLAQARDRFRKTTARAAARGRALFVSTAAAGGLVVAGLLLWVSFGMSRRLDQTVAALRDLAAGEGDLTRRLPVEYANCSEVQNCGHSECEIYGERDACWSRVGSMQAVKEKIQCPTILSGKLDDCSECPVFRMAQRDEFDELAVWFNVFADKIRYVVQEVKEAAGDLAATSEELSASTTQIGTSSAQISERTQVLAASGEQMGSTVQEVAQNTAQVSDAADIAKERAAEGARVVRQTGEALQEIAAVVSQAGEVVRGLGAEAEKIGDVVQVIEDIADQTNLLALNAAIEAARAGEHGRGFAVVADEVRKLAEKTVKATGEIGETIQGIQSQVRRAMEAMDQGIEAVEQGKNLGENAARSIGEVQDRIGGAATQIQQIAAATEELATTVQDLASNLDQIAQGVAENTRAGEEIARTAEVLAQKADELRELTGRFQT